MEIPNGVVKTLDGMKGKLVEQWPSLVRQTYNESLTELIAGAILLMLFIATIFFLIYCIKRYELGNDWDLGIFISVFLSLITVISGAALLIDGLLGIYNPEYYTAETVMRNLNWLR